MHTLVIGAGISAAAYVGTLDPTALGELKDIKVVGKQHLWAKLPADHEMGQPSNLLAAHLPRSSVAKHGSASSSSHGSVIPPFLECAKSRG